MSAATLVAIGYPPTVLVAARLVYPPIREWMAAPEDGSFDRVVYAVVALLAACLWPAALPLTLVMWRPAQTKAEHQAEKDQLRARVAELEDELGLPRSQ